MLKKTLVSLLILGSLIMSVSAASYVYNAGTGFNDMVCYDEKGEITDASKGVQTANIPEVIEGVTIVRIGDQAFWDCPLLETVVIPDTVKSIGRYAFTICHNLKEITIPNSVTTIEDNAFSNSGIKRITIPSTVTSFGINVFEQCDGLVIYGSKGSAAEAYANKYEITFVADVPTVPVEAKIAEVSKCNVVVNGKIISFDAYNINDNNYFKMRDIAAAVNRSAKQFDVLWDAKNGYINLISNQTYKSVGGELVAGNGLNQNYTPTTSTIYKDGRVVYFEAYEINGNNYFKLRDVCKSFNIGVDWNQSTQTIIIDTQSSYVD